MTRNTALVSLHGNSYEVDGSLVGRRVELVFDPFDLTRIEVRSQGVPMGLALPHHIGRHSHPKAKPETPNEPSKPSGIDYMRLIADTHQGELARGLNYAALTSSAAADAKSTGAATVSVVAQTDIATGPAARFPGSWICLPARRFKPT